MVVPRSSLLHRRNQCPRKQSPSPRCRAPPPHVASIGGAILTVLVPVGSPDQLLLTPIDGYTRDVGSIPVLRMGREEFDEKIESGSLLPVDEGRLFPTRAFLQEMKKAQRILIRNEKGRECPPRAFAH